MAISLYSRTQRQNGYIALDMERKAIMSNLGIFQGKQKEHNVNSLTLLFDYGPLTAWEITNKLPSKSKHSLHATLNKSLRKLQDKGYLKKDGSKWILTYKGVIAVLISQKTPKIWNPLWKERFNANVKKIEFESKSVYGLPVQDIQKYIKFSGLALDDFDTWVSFSSIIKNKLDWVDFDRVKESTLLALVIMEAKSTEELATLTKINDTP